MHLIMLNNKSPRRPVGYRWPGHQQGIVEAAKVKISASTATWTSHKGGTVLAAADVHMYSKAITHIKTSIKLITWFGVTRKNSSGIKNTVVINKKSLFFDNIKATLAAGWSRTHSVDHWLNAQILVEWPGAGTMTMHRLSQRRWSTISCCCATRSRGHKV